MSPEQRAAAELWAAGARDALDSAEKLYAAQKFDHALFFCHLAVEKALKALHIVTKDALPPYTHDLLHLAAAAGVALTSDQDKILAEINTFNISGRYAEEKRQLYKHATPPYARAWLDRTKDLLETFLS